MKSFILYISLSFLPFALLSQDLSGDELLDKAIAYHDPNGIWESFQGSFLVSMETPTSSARESEITIDLPNEYFYLKAQRDSITTEYTLGKEACEVALNGSGSFSEEEKKTYHLDCDRGRLMQNYYTYLYGLPMKLKDPGTNVSEVVEKKPFKGKEYLVLKVTYEETVGSDVWFFYFNPKDFQLEVYQFFKGDPNGKGKNTGEYILLSEEENIHGIKMPKIRAWYYNKNDEYLGTDLLKKS